MIDWSKIEVESTSRGVYIVWDRLNDIALMEVRAMHRESGYAKVQKIEARDLRTYPLVSLGTSVASLDNPKAIEDLTSWAMGMLESLVCERCRNNWGPVCRECVHSAGDSLFLTLRQIERIGAHAERQQESPHSEQ